MTYAALAELWVPLLFFTVYGLLWGLVGEELRRMFGEEKVPPGPFIHDFPDLGGDREVTIDCIVRAATRPDDQGAHFDESSRCWIPGISPTRVGALVVEVSKYGLHLRWEADQGGNQRSPGASDAPPSTNPPAQPLH